MTKQVARKLNFRRKLLLSTAAIAAIALPMCFGLVDTQVRAQAAPENPTHNIADTWQGTGRCMLAKICGQRSKSQRRRTADTEPCSIASTKVDIPFQ